MASPVRQVTTQSRELLGDTAEHRRIYREYYWSLFEKKFCNLTTKSYLELPESEIFSARYRRKFVQETRKIKHSLESEQNELTASREKISFRIALTNHSLRVRGGSELWTCDVASYLIRSGANVIVYSPELGPVADELSASTGIKVTSSAVDVQAFEPDLLHVNHFKLAQQLVALLEPTSTKIVNMCHGLLPRQELPQPHNVDQYCATSITSKTMIWLLTEADWSSIRILPNFFDEKRYRYRRVPDGKRKALVYSNKATKQHIRVLRVALAQCGYVLDAAGDDAAPVEKPEELLSEYDLVLAVGRSAIEALASGCRVILWDSGILGPLVTPQNFWQCVCANFALTSMRLPYCLLDETRPEQWLKLQLSEASSGQSNELYEMTRKYLSLDNIGFYLREMYRGVLLEPRSSRRVQNVVPGSL